jgi:hypothetical protein
MSSHQGVAVALFLLGLGAMAVALLRPLASDLIEYHVSESSSAQIKGGDIAGLVLVAPVSILAGILVWRGRLAGMVMALGPAIYALYIHNQLALGNDIARYPGTSEQFFPLYLGLFVLAGGIAIGTWRTVGVSALPKTSPKLDRVFAWFAVLIAVFLAWSNPRTALPRQQTLAAATRP